MSHRHASLLLGAVLAATFAACGNNDSISTGSGLIKTDLRHACEQAFSCQSSYDPAQQGGTAFASTFGTSVDDCYAVYLAQLDVLYGPDFLQKLDASIAAGRILYSSDAGQTCLDAGDARTCDQFFGQNGATYAAPSACGEELVGTVASGDTCTIDEDCAVLGASCVASTMTCGS